MNETQTLPEVGMGITAHFYSDRRAATVVEVLSPRRIVVQWDKATRTDTNGGYSESQTYSYEPDSSAEKVTLSLRKNGIWYKVGDDLRGTRFYLGYRNHYIDPCF